MVDLLPEAALDVPYVKRLALLERLRNSVKIVTSAVVAKIEKRQVIIRNSIVEQVLSEIDQIVLAVGSKPFNELADHITQEIPGLELHLIGDARKPGNMLDAVAEGARIGHLL